ncbi:SRPBCC family protein [Yinghuangia sp. ASG 101]|uniref:type II toxin-antitoxin system Rv0910 family toxin n=1 Tax=Yinghuangia sp. ASG 101 TaxID=2896848 RepID=UPI001E411CD2|nr:SRPBCC family protein [Yinghuangia sp. ASG 101]UGQ10329.1 SRPBCC family protein [Yinghuangia sp. ASG 101]
MPVINEHIEIPAKPDAVWARLVNFDEFGSWMTPHVGFPGGGPDKLEAGVEYDEKMKLMGFPADIKWTVKNVEQGARLDLDGKGPMGVSLTESFVVEAAADGNATVFRIESEVKGGAVAMMAGKVTQATQEAFVESLGKFKALFA